MIEFKTEVIKTEVMKTEVRREMTVVYGAT